MPHYYFHILQPGIGPVRDDEGGDFDDLEAARDEAVACIRDLVASALRYQGEFHTLAIHITDKNGTVLEIVEAHQAKDTDSRTLH